MTLSAAGMQALPNRATAKAFALSLALACAACGSGGGVTRPTAASPGSPVAAPVSAQLGSPGGTVTSADGRLTVHIPAGALAQATTVSVQEITNTAPNGIGSAYRLGPSGSVFAVPVAITFRADLSRPAANQAVWFYDPTATDKYWVPSGSLLRNVRNNLVTSQSTHFSDWSLVASDPSQNMAGTFTVTSSLNVSTPFTANGAVSLAYSGADAVERVYLLSGSATLQTVTDATGNVCTPDSATKNLIPNVAEAFLSPAKLAWAGSALWDLTCGTAPDFIEMVFDDNGMTHLDCARGFTSGAAAPVTTADQATGDYTIDCTQSPPSIGTLRVTWNFLRCGGTCSTGDVCATASAYDCSSGQPVCTDTTFVAAGTACTTSTGGAGVCNGSSGSCVACVQGATCTSANPCAATATIDCSSGAPVCTDQTFLATGTACTSGTAAGVCSSSGVCNACVTGTACTSTNVCATSAAISCTSGGPVCTDQTFEADGTSCTTVSGGVCLSGTCQSCTNGASCVPASPCDVGTLSCGTTPTCVDTGTPVTCPSGQTCTNGTCA